jgi:hypothetical protein
MTDRLALAVNARTAQRRSTCTVCRLAITIGQPIARLIKPAAWVHVTCVPIVASTLHGREQDGGQRRW